MHPNRSMPSQESKCTIFGILQVCDKRHRRSLKRQSALTKIYIGLIMSSIISCTTSLVTKTTATCYKDSDTTSSSWEYSCDINVEQPVPVVDEVYEAIICCTEDLPRNTVNHENNSVEAQIRPGHHARLAFRGHAG